MKTEIFSEAIKNRNKIRFYYGLYEWVVEPYYVACDRNGKKVLYARISSSNEIKKFDFRKIANIKVFNEYKFSPVIPIIPIAS
ncbi:MAG: hypothetical protein JETCAE03_37120 [Ignavibacteriaceae bacterium]|jgi:predicted site-specific integrase-resolvase|uniref:hypothetical protein n=1 Tax=Ignavibacterium TaxID=795750 RepID=UPI002084F6C6|nr:MULTISPECIES: hypothetical protein [Ignavibacterium]MBI5661968.1 hypothetical protein [Ignavibacterium album]GJQ44214.1 MAG: hypothetical protein JETCAE03_37120 [Ignavibacteriaceae bacterium]